MDGGDKKGKTENRQTQYRNVFSHLLSPERQSGLIFIDQYTRESLPEFARPILHLLSVELGTAQWVMIIGTRGGVSGCTECLR